MAHFVNLRYHNVTDIKPVSDEWQLVHKTTGEIRELITFTSNNKNHRWEKVYAKSLADMLEIAGEEKMKVIAYMLRKKDYENRVIETVRSISTGTGVSTRTVNRVLKTLEEHNYIHRLRGGLMRFSPHIMVNGHGTVGAAVIRYWNAEEGEKL